MAETPAPALIGVERVVIACEFEDGIPKAERRGVCEQLVKKAGALTSLPVSLASPKDVDPTDLGGQSKQLLLRVKVAGSEVEQGRKSLALSVTPVRAAVNVSPLPAIQSSVSLLKVQKDWIVQGPVDAFNQLLGSAPRKLRTPIHSEN